jgi:hypothetical protein
MSEEADRRLAALCRRRYGVFTRQEASGCGVPPSTVTHRLRSGRYRRLWPGVLAEAGAPDSREARWLAAVLAVGGEAVLARQTAASIHGLEHGLPTDRIHTLVRSRSFPQLVGVEVHRTLYLDARDVTTVRLLPVTTATRTICDLAGQMPEADLRRVVSAAVRRGLTSASRLRQASARLGRFRGKRGLDRIINQLSPLEAASRAESESLFLRITTRAGIPPTALNHRVRDAFGGVRYLDAVYLPERIPVELDSRSCHGTLLDWHDDMRRENAVVLTGWRDFLRFNYADLRDRPSEVVDVIRLALQAARAR